MISAQGWFRRSDLAIHDDETPESTAANMNVAATIVKVLSGRWQGSVSGDDGASAS
jgi:hypothetical protein